MHFVLFEVHVFLPITPVSGRIERNIRANVGINEGSSDLFSFHSDYFSQVLHSTFRLGDNKRRGTQMYEFIWWLCDHLPSAKQMSREHRCFSLLTVKFLTVLTHESWSFRQSRHAKWLSAALAQRRDVPHGVDKEAKVPMALLFSRLEVDGLFDFGSDGTWFRQIWEEFRMHSDSAEFWYFLRKEITWLWCTQDMTQILPQLLT